MLDLTSARSLSRRWLVPRQLERVGVRGMERDGPSECITISSRYLRIYY